MKDGFEGFTSMVIRAYKHISQIKKKKSSEIGVRGIHVMCLYYLGQHSEGLSVMELSALCCEDKAAISRALNGLFERGYVAYCDVTTKRRRSARITITEEGHIAVKAMDDIIGNVVENVREGLTQEDLVTFYKVFRVINQRLELYCEELDRQAEE
ncbi:MAG: hypothetical protein MR529_01550 [Cuneatibacter sp.]|nr:hypothetical protein [Cuneatibacter sp.]